MKYIQGINRMQTSLFPISLEDSIDYDNEVRIVDAFVNSINIEDYGFKVVFVENGRPAYHPKDLLKLYLYGYLNRVRSSRGLEKECNRNIEVMWLINNLVPDHNTIANFRRDNAKAIKKVFRSTVNMARHFDLIGGLLLAGDSTKLRAQNSKKNNYNQKKTGRHLEYIEGKLEEYNKTLIENDGDKEKEQELKQEIEKQKERKNDYQQLEKQLEESGEPQISTSDPESRQMIIRNNITEVAYNVQTMVDSKNNIPIDYKVTNTNDSKAMGGMLRRAKSILGNNNFTVLYDKGYHTGSEFDIADQLGINVMVAIPATPKSSQAPDPEYNADKFIYNTENNTYTCPQGSILTTNGTWHKASSGSFFQQFKTANCKGCQVRKLCTSSVKNGRIIHRRKYAQNIEANKQRIENNKTTYKKRQAIVEHPYGTIKRQWGFSYIITKQFKSRASADVGLMFTAYNLRRIINILGIDVIKAYLEELALLFFNIFAANRLKKTGFKAIKKIVEKLEIEIKSACKGFKMAQNFAFF